MAELIIKQLFYQAKYKKGNQFLKLRAYMQDQGIKCKEREFLALIYITENIQQGGNYYFGTYTKQQIASNIKFKNQNQEKILIVTWEIPINHMFFPCSQQNIQGNGISNTIDLTLYYKSQKDNRMRVNQKDYRITFKQFYQTENQAVQKRDAMNDEPNEYALYQEIQVQRKGRAIPINIIQKKTLFQENDNIEIQLQGEFSQFILSKFKAHLCQKIYCNNQVISELCLQQLQIAKQDNSQVTFISTIVLDANQMIPLYLGDQIQCHHIIKINMELQQQNCFDIFGRTFNIIIPIEVVNQQQGINTEASNYNDLKYHLVLNDKIEANFCPQLCENYKDYLKVQIVQKS